MCARVFFKFLMCHFVFFRFFGAGGGLKAILTSGPLDKLIGMTTHHPGRRLFLSPLHALAHTHIHAHTKPSRRSVVYITIIITYYNMCSATTTHGGDLQLSLRLPQCLARGGAEVPRSDDTAGSVYERGRL